MLPGSMLPPGVQMSAMHSHDSVSANEEEYAQKHGRVFHPRVAASPRRMALLGVPIIIALTILLVAVFVI